jgi:flagellar motor switch protein FliG
VLPQPAADGLIKGRKAGAGTVRTVPSGASSPDSKYRRAAKFLILIGGDEAARILSELESDQVQAISREIASIRGVTAEEGAAVLEEFRSLLSGPFGNYGSSPGGVETARRLLYAAFGPEKGEEIVNRAVPESRGNSFGFLDDFSPEQVALLLKEETPAAAALILSRLPSKLAASVLARTPGERKTDIARRIARQGQVSPEVLERIASALREKARRISREDGESSRIDGINTLAAILKNGDFSFSGCILGELEEQNPDLGKILRERLYTPEDVINAEQRPLEEKLRTMKDREIAMLVKSASGLFAEKIFSCISARRRALLDEEIESLGDVPKKETDRVLRDFLAWFRQAREEGRILMLSGEDVLV